MNRKQAMNSVLTAMGLATAAGLVILAAPGAASGRPDAGAGAGNSPNVNFSNLPTELVLTGVVRDFKGAAQAGGHADFEITPRGGYAHYMGNVAEYLDADNKPVYQGGGKKVSSQWRDAAGRPIHPSLFNAQLGDRAGAYTGTADSGGITSGDTFRQWFRDVPDKNMSAPLSITLKRTEGSNVYIFDDRTDATFAGRGGFFPIDNSMFGNFSNGKNFHFTYELATEFIYQPGQGQIFTFRGDDDVWVFINGKQVIDIGGIHSAVEQTVALDRLANLVPNGRNTLHFFFAERHTTQSNFRIETTINLRNAELPNTSKLYD